MDLFRKYLLSNVYRSPDEPAAPELAAVDPVAAVADPVAADPPAADAGDADPPAPPAEPEHGNKGGTPWFMKRISDEAAQRRAAEQRASDAEAMLQRLQAAGQSNEPPAATHRPEPQQQDFNSAVRAEAARQRLIEDSTAVRDAGLQSFGPAFGESLSILTAIGATGDDFVQDVLAVDKANAHKILEKLAKDPERAASLVGMTSRQRTAELTRMAMATAAPQTETPLNTKPAVPAKTVSRAPAPAPAVDPSASKVVDWRSDAASEDDFSRGFAEMMAKRAARR